MKESFGNIWDLAGPDDIIVITTNGFVRKDGSAVMGRGIAFQATQRDPDVAKRLGAFLIEHGNHVRPLRGDTDHTPAWISFPVKHHWKDKADLSLIEQSTKELVTIINKLFQPEHGIIGNVYLPRPGCGNGRLKWEDVKPVIEPYLDDRFVVVTL